MHPHIQCDQCLCEYPALSLYTDMSVQLVCLKPAGRYSVSIGSSLARVSGTDFFHLGWT